MKGALSPTVFLVVYCLTLHGPANHVSAKPVHLPASQTLNISEDGLYKSVISLNTSHGPMTTVPGISLDYPGSAQPVDDGPLKEILLSLHIDQLPDYPAPSPGIARSGSTDGSPCTTSELSPPGGTALSLNATNGTSVANASEEMTRKHQGQRNLSMSDEVLMRHLEDNYTEQAKEVTPSWNISSNDERPVTQQTASSVEDSGITWSKINANSTELGQNESVSSPPSARPATQSQGQQVRQEDDSTMGGHSDLRSLATVGPGYGAGSARDGITNGGLIRPEQEGPVGKDFKDILFQPVRHTANDTQGNAGGLRSKRTPGGARETRNWSSVEVNATPRAERHQRDTDRLENTGYDDERAEYVADQQSQAANDDDDDGGGGDNNEYQEDGGAEPGVSRVGGAGGESPRALKSGLDQTPQVDMNKMEQLVLHALPDTLVSGNKRFSPDSRSQPEERSGDPGARSTELLGHEKKEGVSERMDGEMDGDYLDNGDDKLGLDKLSSLKNEVNYLIEDSLNDQKVLEQRMNPVVKRATFDLDTKVDSDGGYSRDRSDLEADKVVDGTEIAEETSDDNPKFRERRNVNTSQDLPKNTSQSNPRGKSSHHDKHMNPGEHGRHEGDKNTRRREGGDTGGEKVTETSSSDKKVKVTGVGYILFNSDGTVRDEQYSGPQLLDGFEELTEDAAAGHGQSGHKSPSGQFHKTHHAEHHHRDHARTCNMTHHNQHGHHSQHPANCSLDHKKQGNGLHTHNHQTPGHHGKGERWPNNGRHEKRHHVPGQVAMEDRARPAASKLVAHVMVVLCICLFAFTILTYVVVKARAQDERLVKVNSRTALFQPQVTY